MTTTLTPLLDHIHRLAAAGPDADLLADYVRNHDEGAFAALVDRHGPMVWGVCRRVLGDVHAAEDAYQATFLVLMRRAGDIRQADRLAGWLYGVALRVARKARGHQDRPPAGDITELPDRGADPLTEVASRETLAALDEEVARLPEVYRTPVLLCCLGGLSQEEAARRLGWTPGSVRGRLERGRARLADRLARRGVALNAALVGSVSALAPPALAPTSAGALTLADAVVGLVIPKWKAVAALLLASLAVGGVGLLATPQPVERHEGSAADPVRAVELHSPASPPLVLEKHTDAFRSLDFSPDGARLAGGAQHGAVWVWDAATGKRVLEIPAPAGDAPVAGVRFSHDGKTLASASDKVRLRDARTGAAVRALDRGLIYTPFDAIDFSPDDRLLVGSAAGPEERTTPAPKDDPRVGVLRVWDVGTGKVVRDLDGSAAGPAAFSPAGRLVAGPAAAGGLRVWEAASGKVVLRLPAGYVSALAFSPDGKHLVVGTNDGRLSLWDAATGKELFAVGGAHFSGIVRVAFTPDGRHLISAGQQRHAPGREFWPPQFDGEVKVWDAATGKERFAFTTHVGGVSGMALSPDGTRVAASTLATGQPVKIWSLVAPAEEK